MITKEGNIVLRLCGYSSEISEKYPEVYSVIKNCLNEGLLFSYDYDLSNYTIIVDGDIYCKDDIVYSATERELFSGVITRGLIWIDEICELFPINAVFINDKNPHRKVFGQIDYESDLTIENGKIKRNFIYVR